MKRMTVAVLAMILAAASGVEVWANSSPVRVSGHPSSELFSVEESSPIAVEDEVLLFDFSKNFIGSHSYKGKVTASYNMKNTLDERTVSKMAFPYIGNIMELDEDELSIRVDGEEIPYDLFYGDKVEVEFNAEDDEEQASVNVSSILNALTTKPYEPRYFDLKDTGTLYRIVVEGSGDSNFIIDVDFDFNSERTKVLSKGFNGYSLTGSSAELSGWISGDTTLEVFVMGEDIDLVVSGYTDGTKEEALTAMNYTIEESEVAFESYFEGYLTEGWLSGLGIRARDLYLAAMDESFSSMVGIAAEDAFYGVEGQDRYILMVYDVAFDGEERKNVEVSYSTTGSMDRSESTSATYTYTYLLGPASHWKEFHNLDVEVRTPEGSPFIVESSIPLTLKEKGKYGGNFEELPDRDLTFTLYEKEDITWLDKTKGTISNQYGYTLIFMGFGLAVLGGFVLSVVAIVNLYKWIRRRGEAL